MAYKNIVAQACTSKNEVFCRLRDFLCQRDATYNYSTTGVGWTLHDAVYATDEDNCTVNDYFVLYSAGEEGYADMYIQVFWVASSLSFRGYQSWDASTHLGSTSYRYNTAAASFYLLDADTDITLYVYSDLDQFVILQEELTTEVRLGCAGTLIPPYEDMTTDVATFADYVAGGSDVSLTPDATLPTTWSGGKELFMRSTHNNDMSTVRLEKTEIKTVVSGSITVDLTYSYPPGAILSETLGYYCGSATSAMSTTYILIDNNGGLNVNQTWGASTVPSATYLDPDALEDRIGLYNLMIYATYGFVGILRNWRYTPTHNAEFTHLDVLVEPNGTEWRCFKVNATKYMAFKEV